jgi:hypothetical protein
MAAVLADIPKELGAVDQVKLVFIDGMNARIEKQFPSRYRAAEYLDQGQDKLSFVRHRLYGKVSLVWLVQQVDRLGGKITITIE